MSVRFCTASRKKSGFSSCLYSVVIGLQENNKQTIEILNKIKVSLVLVL